MLREKIYNFIEPKLDSKSVYDYVMMFVIFISLVPLAFKNSNATFDIIDKVTVTIFIIDYIFRLVTADYKLNMGKASFIIYPFTPLAIIDILSILPSFIPLASGLRVLKVFRLLRTFRVFRAFKLLRYSKSMTIIIDVIRKQSAPLIAVGSLALGYVILSALIIFNVEPDSFSNFFEAVYWATVSLTTVGYGDVYPVTTAGRVIAMLSSFIGIAIVALPAGIITAGYMDEVNGEKDR